MLDQHDMIQLAAMAGGFVVLFFSIFKWQMAELDKRVVIESRARHDLRGELQVITGRLELQVNRLTEESVRRIEHKDLEARMTTAIGKIESRMDNMAEKLESIPVLIDQSQRNGRTLEKLLEKAGGD